MLMYRMILDICRETNGDWKAKTEDAVTTLFEHLAAGRDYVQREDIKDIGQHLARHWDEKQALR